MAEREPVMLGDGEGEKPDPPATDERPTAVRPRPPLDPKPAKPTARGTVDTVHVAGFWRRVAAGWVDLAVILPVATILTWIADKLANVHLPTSRIKGPDFWLDLVLHSDPALMTAFAMFLVVTTIYLMVFQGLLGQTLGMRLLRMRVIDVWGERPSLARCAARTAGYLVGIATVMLGFFWVGFDSEKRGLHDWIAGTYVIKA